MHVPRSHTPPYKPPLASTGSAGNGSRIGSKTEISTPKSMWRALLQGYDLVPSVSSYTVRDDEPSPVAKAGPSSGNTNKNLSSIHMLKSSQSGKHVEFCIDLELRPVEPLAKWSVRQRFKRFKEMDQQLRRSPKYLNNMPALPQTRWFQSFSKDYLELKRQNLENYLRILFANRHISGSSTVAAFAGVNKDLMDDLHMIVARHAQSKAVKITGARTGAGLRRHGEGTSSSHGFMGDSDVPIRNMETPSAGSSVGARVSLASSSDGGLIGSASSNKSARMAHSGEERSHLSTKSDQSSKALYAPLHVAQSMPESEDPLLKLLCSQGASDYLTLSYDMYDDAQDVKAAIEQDKFVLVCLPEIPGAPHFGVRVMSFDGSDNGLEGNVGKRHQMTYQGLTVANGHELHVQAHVMAEHLVGRGQFFTESRKELMKLGSNASPGYHEKSFDEVPLQHPLSIEDNKIDDTLELICSPPTHLTLSSMAGLMLSPTSAKTREELNSLI